MIAKSVFSPDSLSLALVLSIQWAMGHLYPDICQHFHLNICKADLTILLPHLLLFLYFQS